MGKLNYPNQQQPDIEPDKLAAMVTHMAELQSLEPVSNADDVAERLEFFFQWCAKKQLRPTVSLMCLCLGHHRQTLINWQNKGDRRGQLISRAKQVLESLTEQWMTCGRINPVSGIFILKAQFHWKEAITIETASPGQLRPQLTPAEVARQIEMDIPIDDDYEAEVVDR